MERETEPEGMFILMTVLPQIARPDKTCGEGFVYFSSNFWEVTFVLLTCRPVAKKQHGTAQNHVSVLINQVTRPLLLKHPQTLILHISFYWMHSRFIPIRM